MLTVSYEASLYHWSYRLNVESADALRVQIHSLTHKISFSIVQYSVALDFQTGYNT